MDVILAINESRVLENAEFDDTAGLDIDLDFEEIVDYIHRTTVIIPNGVAQIGDRAFYDKRWLTGVEIPNSVTSIGDSAFSDCYYMENISMPDSVTSIGRKAFAYCEGLTSVTITNETATISNDAFYGCSDGLTIRAKTGSSAEEYATENMIRFESL